MGGDGTVLLGLPAAAVPQTGTDPRVALASTLQSSGTMAVLIGSGVSRAAGIMTGWEITLDLIRRVAAAEGHPNAAELTEPEEWWVSTGRGEPRYDVLLPLLAPTDGGRRALLRRYFEGPTGQPAEPTAAHHALAALAARGSVPIILTTNFDRLMERALSAAGVEAQVLLEPQSARGMTPFPHAPVTLVKLHGDYAGGRLLNSPDELATYPPAWRLLLSRVFDEYGLLVVGWSADYDTALAQAVTHAVGRRYPWYWGMHGGRVSEEARRLINGRGAFPVDIASADELLTDLVASVEAIDHLALRRNRPRKTLATEGPSGRRPGWEAMPYVWIRVVAEYGPAHVDDTEEIDAVFRRQLLTELDNAAFTNLLRHVDACSEGISALNLALGVPNRPVVTDFEHWHHFANAYQTAQLASYRLGTDGVGGVSALASIRLGSQGAGDSALALLDVGISAADGVQAATLAEVVVSAVSLVGNGVAAALERLLPSAAVLRRVEVHWAVPQDDGNGNGRATPEGADIRFEAFGEQTRDVLPPGGYAEVWDGPVTHQAAVSFAVRALATYARNSGFLDPTEGLGLIETALAAEQALSGPAEMDATDLNSQP
jgi:hypothetical protein